MKHLSNPIEFFNIHKGSSEFLKINSNMKMRFFINSYGFRADRELADKMLSLRGA